VSETNSWQGNSGRWYEFEVVRAQRDWDHVGGVYMFVKPKDPEQPSPLHTVPNWGGPISVFVAKTENFALTLARHEMWRAAENLGAKEIHLMVIHDPKTRELFERDLLAAQAPILNRSVLKKAA
jgi:hypothetical protein